MRLLRSAAAVALYAAAACGDSTGPADVSGRYVLQTVNGSPPPVVVYEDEFYKLEVISAEYTLNANSTYVLTSQLREDDGAVFQEEEFGTFSVDGSRITLDDDEGFDSLTATISGRRLIFSELGLTAVYEKVPDLE